MRNNIRRLCDLYVKAEQLLKEALNEMDTSDGEDSCECDKKELIAMVEYGDPHFGPELIVTKYCLECGKVIEEIER